MARTESFDDLLQAIQGSFMKVNQLSQQQHIGLLEQYFDSENKPVCVEMKYPARGENGELTFTEVEIPKICMVPISSLNLKEITVDFKVKLAGKVRLKSGSWSDIPEDTSSVKSRRKPPKDEFVGYVPHASKREKNGFANIHLKLESEEPPEGVMRIRDSMIRVMP